MYIRPEPTEPLSLIPVALAHLHVSHLTARSYGSQEMFSILLPRPAIVSTADIIKMIRS